jgi:hypothetical protein
MILARTYASRTEIPRGAEALYTPTGSLFVMKGATRDIVADNPWEGDNWNLTEQGRFIAQYGLKVASAFAKVAGTTVGGLKPRVAQHRPDLTVLIQRRNITTGASGATGGNGASLAAALATKV